MTERPEPSGGNEPQDPSRRRFLRFMLTGTVVGVGATVGSIGISDMFRSTRPQNHRMRTEADRQIPPPSDEEIEKARDDIREFNDDLQDNIANRDVDSIQNTVDSHSKSLDDAFQVLEREEANLKLIAQKRSESGVYNQGMRDTAMVIGGYLGAAFGGIWTYMLTMPRRRSLQAEKISSTQTASQ